MQDKVKVSGGTGLSEEDIRSGKIFLTEDSLDCAFAWDTGVAITRYLNELKKGKIIASECRECSRIMLPPRMFCELCFRPSGDWVYVQDTGTVNTFSICHVHWDASRIKEGEKPYLPAVIEIDGASSGMGIMHLLGEVEPDAIKIGMKVKAVWKPEDERTGAITDIKYFKPL
ncbi:MAG: Zn-ribbon domain-containing OB-fold protein [Bacillota bacterium]|nr:Zn-ribbon domain-containing OB-fold protein [Bacillota bacterium]